MYYFVPFIPDKFDNSSRECAYSSNPTLNIYLCMQDGKWAGQAIMWVAAKEKKKKTEKRVEIIVR